MKTVGGVKGGNEGIQLYCQTVIHLSVLRAQCIHYTQVIAAGYASCTGLSIFLVDALRSVGIPARVAGITKLSGGLGCDSKLMHNMLFL